MYECFARGALALSATCSAARTHRPRREFTLVLLSLSSMKERGEKL